MTAEGVAHGFGDDVSTDHITSGRHRFLARDLKALAAHCLEDLDPGFAARVQPGDFVVAGRNFGCGSSREYAPRVIQALGIRAVLARSLARIFYRNAINIGLPAIDATIDYLTPAFLGVRTTDALIRVYGRDLWGWPVGVAMHLFADDADGPTTTKAWSTWLDGLFTVEEEA